MNIDALTVVCLLFFLIILWQGMRIRRQGSLLRSFYKSSMHHSLKCEKETLTYRKVIDLWSNSPEFLASRRTLLGVLRSLFRYITFALFGKKLGSKEKWAFDTKAEFMSLATLPLILRINAIQSYHLLQLFFSGYEKSSPKVIHAIHLRVVHATAGHVAVLLVKELEAQEKRMREKPEGRFVEQFIRMVQYTPAFKPYLEHPVVIQALQPFS